jgi:hypothetical protein
VMSCLISSSVAMIVPYPSNRLILMQKKASARGGSIRLCLLLTRRQAFPQAGRINEKAKKNVGCMVKVLIVTP